LIEFKVGNNTKSKSKLIKLPKNKQWRKKSRPSLKIYDVYSNRMNNDDLLKLNKKIKRSDGTLKLGITRNAK